MEMKTICKIYKNQHIMDILMDSETTLKIISEMTKSK
jgi:hypothetical protein